MVKTIRRTKGKVAEENITFQGYIYLTQLTGEINNFSRHFDTFPDSEVDQSPGHTQSSEQLPAEAAHVLNPLRHPQHPAVVELLGAGVGVVHLPGQVASGLIDQLYRAAFG